MSFAGSVLAMINSLKNNARPKRIPYGNWKRKEIRYRQKKRPEYKTVSAEELERIKFKIRNKARKQKTRALIMTLIIILAIVGGIIWRIVNDEKRKIFPNIVSKQDSKIVLLHELLESKK